MKRLTLRSRNARDLKEMDAMSFYDEDTGVAVRDRMDEEYDRTDATGRRSDRLERAICPNCRMLLSVIETRIGKCRSCRKEIATVVK